MKKIYKSFVAFFLVSMMLVSSTAFAITQADTTRVFKKLHEDPVFMPQLYQTVPLYAELSVTKESVDSKIEELIYAVLTIAEAEKNAGTLTPSNLKSRLKTITIDRAMAMEAVYIALCTDAFSEETVASLIDGVIPAEFEPLYHAIAEEAYIILGFVERQEITHVFDDLAGYEWAEEAIAFLYDKGIINGVGRFRFAPGTNVAREQFAKMMCIAFDITPGSNPPVFSDVTPTDWFHPYVTTMASRNLIQGVGEGRFGSGKNITRQDMAVLMFRMGEMLGAFDRSTSKNSKFEDDRYIAPYAKTAVITLQELGIINGNGLNCFNPTMPATRAEAAQMLYRCYQYVNK